MIPAHEVETFGYRLDLAYEGSAFHGFARQPTVRTVQGELEKALAVALREEVSTTCAGRTDAGVHARRQVVSMTLARPIDRAALLRSLRKLLPADMAVRGVFSADPGWNARFSARWRAYRYRVRTHPVPDPLTRRLVWHVGRPLALGAMNEASAHLVGTHDFASFCRAAEGRSTRRTVEEARWQVSSPDELQFRIVATAFCHQMVRSLVGWCVEVGRGRRTAAETPRVLTARSRRAAGPVAPPRGLILWDVGYGPEEEEQRDGTEGGGT